MLALALALSASLCWGVADFLGGVATRRLPSIAVVLVSQTVGLVVLACVVAATAGLALDGQAAISVLIAGVTAAVAIPAFYRALSIGTMSVVAPITATGAAIPVIVGLAAGERPSAWQGLGVALAFAGVLATTRAGPAGEERRRASRASLAWAVLAAVALGTGLAALDHAAVSGALAVVFWSRLVSVGLLVGLAIALRQSFRGVGGGLQSLAALGLLDVAAVALYSYASTLGLIAEVAVAASLYPVVTVVLATTILRERIRRLQGVGIATTLVGVCILAAG